MKKIIEGFFAILLVCFSFFYTDKVINTINASDPLMSQITQVKSDYDILPVNAILSEDTIIPGIIGREIDTQKSYDNMKLGGIFREDALVFRYLSPTNSVVNNMDKYIIKGNGSKNDVSIIVIFNNSYINTIEQYDDLTIFVNHKDLTIDNIKILKNKEVYTYGNRGVYSNEILVSDNSLINRISNNKSNYCLVKEKNDETLKVCNDNSMYVVFPNIIGNYYEIKNNLSNGSIILLDSFSNIDIIIKYIGSKGYDIVPLGQLLSE